MHYHLLEFHVCLAETLITDRMDKSYGFVLRLTSKKLKQNQYLCFIHFTSLHVIFYGNELGECIIIRYAL